LDKNQASEIQRYALDAADTIDDAAEVIMTLCAGQEVHGDRGYIGARANSVRECLV
jgi:hypothetical protein